MATQQSQTIAPARRCAYGVVCRVIEHRAWADRALRSHARGLTPRDRALAMRLTYGTVQRLGTLDHLIEQLAERPLKRLEGSLRAALALGLYELIYMDGAPDRAVISDAVELAKRDGHSGGHGLVNAVLRRAVRDAPGLIANFDDRTPEGAAIAHSHPEWMVHKWWDELGSDQARALLAANNEPAEVALRVNTLLADPESVVRGLGVPIHTDANLPEALVLDVPLDVYSSDVYKRGAIAAQSRAAMLVAHALDPQPHERILDLCAAPGGKSAHIAALMDGSGEILAVERNRQRAQAMRENLTRLGARNVTVLIGDATQPTPQRQLFDRVLVDPPCSGLGTLQSHPDLRWHASQESIAEMARGQAAILGAGAQAVRPGGVLVYSTCTVSAAENERVICDFLNDNPQFELDDLGARWPALHDVFSDTRGFLLTLVHRDATAGFFIARMRRR